MEELPNLTHLFPEAPEESTGRLDPGASLGLEQPVVSKNGKMVERIPLLRP